jgi:hypothetical protein
MVRIGKINGEEYKLPQLMKIIEDKTKSLGKKTIVLENDVKFPVEPHHTPNIRGLILRALEGKKTIYDRYGYSLTNKNHIQLKTISNNSLRNTSTMTVKIFRSLIEDLINIMEKKDINIDEINKSNLQTKTDLQKLLVTIEKYEELYDKTLFNLYNHMPSDDKEYLINQLFNIIAKSIVFKSDPKNRKFITLLNELLENNTDNVIKLKFINSLTELYYNQQHQKKTLVNTAVNATGGNRSTYYSRSNAKKTSRKSKSRRKSKKN